MNLLATVSPSDGIPKEFHAVFWGIYAIAAMTGFVGVVMRMQTGWRRATEEKLAVFVFLVGMVPFAWQLHIYRIDFFPHYQDGTPASPPLWKAMAVPVLPALCGLCLLLFRRRPRQKSARRFRVADQNAPHDPDPNHGAK